MISGDAHSMSSEDLEDYLAPYLQSGQNEAEYYYINIATGETSQAITPFHFFDNFYFHH